MEKVSSSYFSNVGGRSLRSGKAIEIEAPLEEAPKHCNVKVKTSKTKKQLPKSRAAVTIKKEKVENKPSIKSEIIIKTELCSDDDFTANLISDIVKAEQSGNLSPAKRSSVSPRKRKQIKNESNTKKTEKVIKTEPPQEASTQDIEDIPWQPDNWRKVLDNILIMRKLHVAPVDSLGCEECPEEGVTPEVFRFQTLISVMLSSQTRDEVTYAATQRLIEHGLTVDSILNTPDEKIGELIYPAGFWKSKVQFIKKTSRILKDQYNGDIPRTFKELIKLPGVGPKMANIVMSVAWNDTVGIAVDTHVHRISNRLGWVKKPTKDPEQTRKALESWLPKHLWKDTSLDLVGFGQTICKPTKPRCSNCLNVLLCPFYKNNV